MSSDPGATSAPSASPRPASPRPAPPPLRRQQAEALAALDEAWRAGRRAAWVVLPPGGGKTRVGVEAALRLRRRTVVLGPNTAIQGQWIAQCGGLGLSASDDRSLSQPATVLTYQALAVFDPDAGDDAPAEPEEGEDPEQARGPQHLDRLHPNARALVDTLAAAGPLTLVLDECHHLLEVWGELLGEVLGLLPDVVVVALTATPPEALSADEADLVARLFGPIVYSATIPSFVRDGHLAPFRELVRFTDPTTDEAAYVSGEARRFAELRSDLMAPGFATTGFLAWLDGRFVRRQTEAGTKAVPWSRLERDRPDLTAAVLRAHTAGLLGLPEGARVREEHRAPLDAEDWVELIEDYVVGCLTPSADPTDVAALEAIRRAVPSVGYRVTKRGLARTTSPVDRVVARSAAKGTAAVGIVDAEWGVRGDGLRALVLCDFERASAQVPARLVGVLEPEEGSARGVLRRLVADPTTVALDPVLVSGRSVACSARTAPRLVAWLRTQDPGLELADPPAVDGAQEADLLVDLEGRWSPRRWVPLLTRWFEEGQGRVLVGTRALLGEGWDARGINVLVDLTTATTPVAVTQTRGRALRTDPRDPDKVAHTWTVVCVADGHPLGDADYRRLVRKHRGFFAVTDDGLITDGVAHVHPELSPYAPPTGPDRERINVEMTHSAADHARTRALWQVGAPYDDVPVVEVRVRAARPLGADLRVGAVTVAGAGARRGVADAVVLRPRRDGTAAVSLRSGRWRSLRSWLSGGDDLAAAADRATALESLACAVADALSAGQAVPRGADAVRVAPTRDGQYRVWLDGVPEEASAVFSDALDEVVSPLFAPRYVVPRYVIEVPDDPRERRRLAWRRLWRRRIPVTVVWHAVPSVLGVNKERAALFGAAWNRWVSPGEPLYTGSPEGAGVLAAQRGDDPFAVTTAVRTEWR
ncbi:MAG: DEAD/DEAH box helicase family protein [Candidatus Nanopelagicales bacterium]